MQLTIRRVLVAVLAVVVLVVAGSLIVAALWQEQRNERHLAAAIISGIHVQADEELQQLIGPLDRQLRVELERVALGQLPRGNTEAIKDQLLPSMRHLRGVESMMVGDETGYQLLLMRWSKAVAASPLLRGVPGVPLVPEAGIHFITRDFRLQEWGQRSRWTLWDLEGRQPLARWEADLPDYDPRQRPWLTQALARLHEIESVPAASLSPIAWTDVYSLFTTKTPGVSVSAAARGPDGRATVVAFDLLLDELCEFTRGLQPTPNGGVFMCTAQGLALALPNDARFADPAKRSASLMQPIGAVGSEPLAQWAAEWRRRDGNEPSVFTFDAGGQAWWGAWRAFDLGGKDPIWLGVVVPRHDLMRLVAYDRGNYAMLVLAGFVAALLLATWFSWRLARPLREVVDLSRRIGALDLEEQSPPSSRILEVRQLIEALVTMRTALRGHVEARERAVRELATGEERFRTTFQLAAVGIAHIGLDNRFLVVNDHFCSMLGRSREELLRLRAVEVTWPDARVRDFDRWQEFLARMPRDDTAHWDKQWQHSDGRVVQAQESLRLLRDERGQPSHCVLVVQDMSERLDLEDRLRQSQRLEAVGRLAGGVAHDFNNLLTGMLGHMAMAIDQLPPGHAATAEIRQAESSAGSAAALVRQLLTFARRDRPDRRVVDVGAYVLESESLLRRSLAEHVELVVAVARGPHPVFIDPTQLQQVIVNLAVNARDAMPDGGRLEIAVDRWVDKGADQVVITVSDNGVGMSEEVRGHAFDPFFTTKGPDKGTGLGLATCYAIVEQAGGSITLASSPGRGTTASIVLPMSDAPVTLESQRPPQARGGGETILFVEDEASIRGIMQRTLEAKGYRVLTTSSGEQALAIAERTGHLDLLLTDVIMPGMHGGELARRLRTDYPELRVLFMSGYARSDLDTRLFEGSAYLPKPYTPEDLLQRVREVLDDVSSHQGMPPS